MRESVREFLFGAVFLVMGLLQFILLVVRAEPHVVNLVLGAVFFAGGLYFVLPVFLRRKPG